MCRTSELSTLWCQVKTKKKSNTTNHTNCCHGDLLQRMKLIQTLYSDLFIYEAHSNAFEINSTHFFSHINISIVVVSKYNCITADILQISKSTGEILCFFFNSF